MKPTFKKFNDVTVKDINVNFHIHTDQTDGTSTPEEMIKKAIELKLKAIAFTEHVRASSDWFDGFAAKITALKNNKEIAIFLGIETKALDFNGTIDAAPGMIAKSDIVVGVVHRYPDGRGGWMSSDQIQALGQDQMAEIECNLAMGLLKNKAIDVLGHPFGMYAKLYSKFPGSYMEQLLIESVKRCKAIEINTKYLPDIKMFFKLLRQINPIVSIGSDAHSADELARYYDVIRANIS